LSRAQNQHPVGSQATDDASPKPAGGQGRLARLLATRGGKAAAEAPFVIEHREALIYMLCEAAELEHGIMCQYLFAAFSLKQSQDEGLSAAEQPAVQRWQAQVSKVATEEMLHLALVHNLLSALGAAPHLARPNLPAPAGHYPAGVQFVLLPFGGQSLRHFMFLERPEGMGLSDADGLAAMNVATPVSDEREIVGDQGGRGAEAADQPRGSGG
jgi:Ferritin-like